MIMMLWFFSLSIHSLALLSRWSCHSSAFLRRASPPEKNEEYWWCKSNRNHSEPAPKAHPWSQVGGCRAQWSRQQWPKKRQEMWQAPQDCWPSRERRQKLWNRKRFTFQIRTELIPHMGPEHASREKNSLWKIFWFLCRKMCLQLDSKRSKSAH